MILSEHPFDAYLYKNSRLFRRSRALFLKQGGKFRATLLSSARSLGSAGLLRNEIEYSPIASELSWSCADKVQRKDLKHIEMIRAFTNEVFHEQNHRILWTFLRKESLVCPTKATQAFRFLNLTESLVILLDMAMADSFDQKTARALYAERATYSSGAEFMRALKPGTVLYREALQVCLHATYLRLEGLHPEDIPMFVRQVFLDKFKNAAVGEPKLSKKVVDLCIERSTALDPLFVELTNPIWQKKNIKAVMLKFGLKRPKKGTQILIPPDRKPLEYRESYGLAEKWLKQFGL